MHFHKKDTYVLDNESNVCFNFFVSEIIEKHQKETEADNTETEIVIAVVVVGFFLAGLAAWLSNKETHDDRVVTFNS